MWRWVSWSIAAVLFLVVLISILLLYPVVQTWLAQQLSTKLSKDLGTTIRIERVELRLFGTERLHGVFIADLKGDTLIAADEIRVRRVRLSLSTHRVSAGRLELHRARFNLAKAEGEQHSNLTDLLDKLAGSDTTSGGAEWRIGCSDVDIQDLHFTYHDANVQPLPFGVDFDHVDVTQAFIQGRDLRLAGDSVLLDIGRIALRDHSGLVLDTLSGATRISPRGIRINDLLLRTPGTRLAGDLEMYTDSFADYSSFTDHVRLKVDLEPSRVQFADIALFAPGLEGMDLPVRVSGHVRGTVAELRGRGLDIGYGGRTHFRGNAELTGLPDVPNTFMVVDVDELTAAPEDLATIPLPPFKENSRLQLPAEVQRLGVLGFSGNFTGFINSFTTYGHATTAAGAVDTDITYERDTVSQFFTLHGRLATEGFSLGRMLDEPALGTIACNTKVDASGRDVNTLIAELHGEVSRLEVDRLSIGNISLDGKLEKNLFNGVLHCDDPNVKLDFNGLADLRGRWPVVDFTADVKRLDLRALGLIGGKGFSDLVMRVTAKGELAPDSLKGSVRMEDVTYCQDSVDLELGDIFLEALRENGRPVLQLQSTLADARVVGDFYPTRLPGAIASVVYSVFPALAQKVEYRQEEQDFTFDATLKRVQPVLDLLLPGLEVDSGTRFNGAFDSRTFDLALNAHVPFLRYGAFAGDSVEIVLDKTLDVLAFRLLSARTGKGQSYMSGIELTGKAYQDEVQLRAGWEGSSSGAQGELNINALLQNDSSMAVDLQPSRLFFGRGNWVNERTAHIQVSGPHITVDTLEMRNADQVVRLGGGIAKDSVEALGFELLDVALENILPFYDGPALHGKLSGQGSVFNIYRTPMLLSYLCIDSLAIENRPVGDVRFAATYNDASDKVDVNGSLKRGDLQALGFTGTLAPGSQEELAVKLLLDSFDLRFLEPYLPSAISDIQGTVSGTIDVTGRLASPRIKGSALMQDAGLRVAYLNTFYSFTHRVDIEPDMFKLDFVKLHDEEGNTATAIGTIIHHGLKDWNFDVSMTMDTFLVLNTSPSDNELYYGKAYATGDLNVSGEADNLEVNVDARTERGTDIHFPLSASRDVGGISFIRFVSPGSTADSLAEVVDLTGIHLDMNVEVTPAARFELIFDPTVGDIMRGSGRGNIAMTVTQTGEFSMKGDVELTEGDYLFTLRNLVNKRFGVEPGGHITWYGDPFDANISVDAIYKLRAALYDVMPAALRTEAYKKRVPVEVLMHLSQKLMNPDITFDVRLPSVDEGVRTQVSSALSNQDELNKQVFALVVLNRFVPTDAAGAQNTSDFSVGGATTGTELLSNQVSNWLSRMSKDVDVGLNLRSGDAITQNEAELALSTQIFNDRLQITTNVGVQYGSGGTQQGTNNFIGDFSAEYRLTQDGKLRLKAYSQSNDRNLNQVDQAPTTQGIGLAYSEEFNRFRELLMRIDNLFRSKEGAKVKEQGLREKGVLD
ncbi:MAG: translocation/assembly module TamB domain-containing protein [Flavobacteriales bacterium]